MKTKNLLIPKKQKGTQWLDSENRPVEKKRCNASEIYNDSRTLKIAKDALNIIKKLSELKELVNECSIKSYELSIADEIRKPSKDQNINHTWYSFDKIIKIQMNTRITKKINDEDRMAINDHFKKALEFDNISSVIKNYIRKIISINDRKIQSADILKLAKMSDTESEHFNNAIHRAKEVKIENITTQYHIISIKDEDGLYINLPLNYATIDEIENYL